MNTITLRSNDLPVEIRGLRFDLSESELSQSYAERAINNGQYFDSVRIEFNLDINGDPEPNTLQFMRSGFLVGSLNMRSGEYLQYRCGGVR